MALLMDGSRRVLSKTHLPTPHDETWEKKPVEVGWPSYDLAFRHSVECFLV
jgi:hypothetical protein